MPKMTTATLAKLAARLKEIDAESKELAKEKAQIVAKLDTLKPGQTPAGEHTIVRSPFRTLDTELIVREFPATEHDEFYKLALDTQEFKKHFSQVELEKYQKVTYRISVK